MGVADEGNVRTAQKASMFWFSIFHRFTYGKVPD